MYSNFSSKLYDVLLCHPDESNPFLTEFQTPNGVTSIR